MNPRSVTAARIGFLAILALVVLIVAPARSVDAVSRTTEPFAFTAVSESSIPEDMDNSNCVDLHDITLLAGRWRDPVPAGDPGDLNGNRVIDVGDIARVASQLGRGCQRVFGVVEPSSANSRQMARDARARWIRQAISWASIEPNDLDLTNPANGNWPDGGIQARVDDGFTLILIITTNPGWAVETVPGNKTCGPIDVDNLPEFEEFMRALAERYDGDGYKDAPGSPIVEHFEMYNEPEKLFPYGWTGCWAGDGSPSYGTRYAEMLSHAWQGVHDANPNAKVLFGGMGAEEGTGGDFDMSGGDWLDDVLGYIQANPGNYFDWMNIHAYWFFSDRWIPYGGPDILGKVKYFEQRLAGFGLNKPMVITETTLPYTGYSQWDHPDGELQSRYVVQAFIRSLAVGAKATTWHRLKDMPGESPYGLLDSSETPRDAYWVYKTLTDELTGFSYDRTLSASDTGWSDIEGYAFDNASGTEKWVLWTPTEKNSSTEAVRNVAFPFSQVRVVPRQKYNATYPDTEIPGTVLDIADGDGGDLGPSGDGKVTIQVGPSPVFVEQIP